MKNVSVKILEAIGGYADALQAAINKYWAEKYQALKPPLVVVNMGYKYAQIVKVDIKEDGSEGSKSVHSFIDLKSGDILKAASWMQPAKGVRGSIFDANFGVGSAVNEYGALYIKGSQKGAQLSKVIKE